MIDVGLGAQGTEEQKKKETSKYRKSQTSWEGSKAGAGRGGALRHVQSIKAYLSGAPLRVLLGEWLGGVSGIINNHTKANK